jgi:hypothetical protein
MAALSNDPKDRCSAFFFVGGFEPAELANFNLQNIFLPGGGVLEVLGDGVAIWWSSRPRQLFDELRDATRDWLETIAAGYFLLTGTGLSVRLRNWVEALDVRAEEAVVGFMDSRFRSIRPPEENHPVNEPLRQAVGLASLMRGRKHLQPAVKELWRAGLDPSDEAFLSAYRALECLRRLYGEDERGAGKKRAWEAMSEDLRSEPPDSRHALAKAAQAVRHGDRPMTLGENHPLTPARLRRSELIGYARSLVAQKTLKELERDLATDARDALAAQIV